MDSMDTSLSKLQETVKGRETWWAIAHIVAKTDKSERLNNNNNKGCPVNGAVAELRIEITSAAAAAAIKWLQSCPTL